MQDVINLERVSKWIGRREILKDVNLTVRQGDIFGYLGPNGAGKTTTIRIILGLMEATSGKVTVLGQDVRIDRTRQKIGFVLETDGLYDNMTAYDNLVYYSQLYDIPHPAERIRQAIHLVELTDRAGDKVGNYSKGMRQRLALARAVLPNPDVLVLDEPTSGVDPTGQIEIREIMLNMAHKAGKTILLSSHNLDEVQRICNRVALIHRGQIRLQGELDKLQREMSSGEVVIETVEPLSTFVMTELQALPEVRVRDQRDGFLTLAIGKEARVYGIVALLVSRGVKIEGVKKQEVSLEEIYTTIVKEAEQQ
jgi:ABC-2 type transport system ATP-binding protein